MTRTSIQTTLPKPWRRWLHARSEAKIYYAEYGPSTPYGEPRVPQLPALVESRQCMMGRKQEKHKHHGTYKLHQNYTWHGNGLDCRSRVGRSDGLSVRQKEITRCSGSCGFVLSAAVVVLAVVGGIIGGVLGTKNCHRVAPGTTATQLLATQLQW